MNYHLAIQDGAQGPFSEQQVQTMLASGTVTPQTLAWREGEKNWQPLSTFGLEAAPAPLVPPALPPPKQSALGMVALVFGIVGLLGWLVVFGVAGVAGLKGYADESFNTFLGLFVLAGLFCNLVMMVLSLVALAGTTRRAVPLAAALLNALELLGVIALMVLGLMMRS